MPADYRRVRSVEIVRPGEASVEPVAGAPSTPIAVTDVLGGLHVDYRRAAQPTMIRWMSSVASTGVAVVALLAVVEGAVAASCVEREQDDRRRVVVIAAGDVLLILIDGALTLVLCARSVRSQVDPAIERLGDRGGHVVDGLSAPGNAVGVDGDQALVAWNDSGTLRITRYNLDGGVVWSRGFTGRAAITQITADPNHAVLFGGELLDSIDFGGDALPLRSIPDGPVNGFFVLLSQAGDHLMSRTVGQSQVNGLATNGENIAVFGVFRTQLHHLMLGQFGTNRRSFSTGFSSQGLNAEELGDGGRVVIGASGRIWWNLSSKFPAVIGFPISW